MSRFGTITEIFKSQVWTARRSTRTRPRTHTLVVSWPWKLLTPTEDAPPPQLKGFNCSQIAFIIPVIQISAASSGLERYAYHELFWHQDLLIFTSNISSHQSALGMVVGRSSVRGWEPPRHTHTHAPHPRHSHRRPLSGSKSSRGQ